jgi:hypothetical protein
MRRVEASVIERSRALQGKRPIPRPLRDQRQDVVRRDDGIVLVQDDGIPPHFAVLVRLARRDLLRREDHADRVAR